MHKLLIVGIVVPALLLGACNRNPESREPVVGDEATNTADEAAQRQQERADDIALLDQRVAEIEKKYVEANDEVVADKKTPTAGLKEALEKDVNDVKQAVDQLRTTTPDNWWARHEEAMRRTADDIEADISQLAGKVTAATPPKTENVQGEPVSTAPFTSQRDEFVTAMHSRVDAMKQALDNVKANGPKETEVEDVRARVNALGDDVDRLRSASPDDWWDVTRSRVTQYVDRIDSSVKRLDRG